MGCQILGSMKYVKSRVYKSDVLVNLSYACMISRIPMLMIGNPGTGKSHTSKIIAGLFGKRDEDWFYQSITAKTSPEKLFGGLIAEKMLNGIEEYNLSVGAASKNGIIFDELYKSQHPAMMNSLLNLYDEEPTIFSGGKNIAVGWHWCFNTTNFEDLPEDLRFCPLWDRQGAKFKVDNLNNSDSKKALKMCIGLVKNAKSGNSPLIKLTIEDLELARKASMAIECPDDLIDTFYSKVLPILEKYCYISQRKINSLFIGKPGHPSILQSIAYISGGSISDETLSYVPYFCWQDTASYDKVINEVQKVLVSPVISTYKEIIRDVVEMIEGIIDKKYSHIEAIQQQKFLTDSITARVSAYDESQKKKAQSLRMELGRLIKTLNKKIGDLAPKPELDNMEF
jgi:hypothetical protein